MIDYGKYLEKRYEEISNEPWSELEKRVRARHPEFFKMLDWLEEIEQQEQRKWWQIWR